MFEFLYRTDLLVLYPVVIALIAGSAELGNRLGQRARAAVPQADDEQPQDFGTLTGAALGMLALLLAFTFSIALARFDSRRDQVLEEANAIGSTANFTLLLPAPAQKPILDALRDYTRIRIGLGTTTDGPRFEADIKRSVELQSRLWQLAAGVAATAPQSLPTYQFVASLNEMNNVHERRLTALRYHVPGEVMFLVVCLSMVSMAFAGYNAGMSGAGRHWANLIMSASIAVLILMVLDLDRPTHGLIDVSVAPLEDTLAGMPR